MSDFQSNTAFTPSSRLYPYDYRLPLSLMPDFITFWCVIDGDYAPFRISVHRDGDIAGLKEVIKQKRENALRDFDAPSLVVWMVRTFHMLQADALLILSCQLNDPEPVDPEGTLAQRIRSRGDVASFANQLNSTQIMSALFPEHRGAPLKNHVYVMVSLRSTGEHIAIVPFDHH